MTGRGAEQGNIVVFSDHGGCFPDVLTPLQELCFLSVEYSVVAVLNPVTYIDILCVGYLPHHGCMAVTEKEIVESPLVCGNAFQLPFGAVLINGFLVIAAVDVGLLVVFAPAAV